MYELYLISIDIYTHTHIYIYSFVSLETSSRIYGKERKLFRAGWPNQTFLRFGRICARLLLDSSFGKNFQVKKEKEKVSCLFRLRIYYTCISRLIPNFDDYFFFFFFFFSIFLRLCFKE